MIFFYTGAIKFGQAQPVASRSLGGFISSTIVPNGRMSNLFSGISKNLIENPRKQIRVLALQNLSGQTQNIKIFTETDENNYSNILLGYSQPIIDPVCGDKYFEELFSEDSLPYTVQIASHEGLGNAIEINDFENNSYIGLFIMRELKSDIPGYAGNTITCEQVYEQYLAEEPLSKEELFHIKVTY